MKKSKKKSKLTLGQIVMIAGVAFLVCMIPTEGQGVVQIINSETKDNVVIVEAKDGFDKIFTYKIPKEDFTKIQKKHNKKGNIDKEKIQEYLLDN